MEYLLDAAPSLKRQTWSMYHRAVAENRLDEAHASTLSFLYLPGLTQKAQKARDRCMDSPRVMCLNHVALSMTAGDHDVGTKRSDQRSPIVSRTERMLM